MKIPRELSLLGYRITVDVVEPERWQDPDCYGIWDSPNKRIFVRGGYSEQAMQHVFLHELTHAILDCLELPKLYADERFVDTFSGLLHQALTSAEYD